MNDVQKWVELKLKGGFGISHIAAKHGVETLFHVLEVVATAPIERYVAGNKTVILGDGEYEAVLSLTKSGEKESWLLTGWNKIENAGETSEVSTQSSSTQINPTFSREDLGAALAAYKGSNSSEDSKTLFSTAYHGEAAVEGSFTRFSIRTKPAPAETKPVWKLMRLGADGKLYPLYIDRNTQGLELHKWYDAETPKIDKDKLEIGYSYLLDADGNILDRIAGLKGVATSIKGKKPSKEQIKEAAANGHRWIGVTAYADGTKSINNLGISGNAKTGEGGVAAFAMRPGWHAGSLPSMKQIKGRSDDMVWVKGRVAYGNGAVEEAAANGGEINDHIPVDGGYLKATSSFNEPTVDWYISGAFMPEEIMSDADARAAIDEFNAENHAHVPYDIARPGNKMFNAKTMSFDAGASDGTRFSIKNRQEFDAVREKAAKEVGIVHPEAALGSFDVLAIPRHTFKPDENGSIIAPAKIWAKANLTKTLTNEETGGKGEITITSKSIDEALGEKAIEKSLNLGLHLAVLQNLPEVIRHSRLVETHPDYKKGEGNARSPKNGYNTDNLMHRLYAPLFVDGKELLAKVTIKEIFGEKAHTYSFEVTKIELLKANSAALKWSDTRVPEVVSQLSAANVLRNVEKSYEPGVKVLDAVHKSLYEAGGLNDVQKWVELKRRPLVQSSDIICQGIILTL